MIEVIKALQQTNEDQKQLIERQAAIILKQKEKIEGEMASVAKLLHAVDLK